MNTSINIEELPVTFEGKGEVSGDFFIQELSTDSAYLYKRRNITPYYEVFKRKLVKKYDFVNNIQLDDMKVMYPKTKDFGVWAWCFRDLTKALKKYKELNS